MNSFIVKFVFVGVLLASSGQNLAQSFINYPGDVNIGVLVDLHNEGIGEINGEQEPVCGNINIEAVQQVLAAKWAVDVINNQSLPEELKIGLIRVGAADYLMTAGAALNLSIYSGLIGVGTADYLMTAGAALNAFHVPVVTVDPNFYLKAGSGDRLMENVLTTAPDLSGQARALARLGFEVGASRVSLISSSQQSIASFLAESTTLGIRVSNILELVPRQLNIGPAVEGFLLSLARDTQPVVAVVLDPADVVAVAEHLKHVNINNQPIWILGSLGLELQRLKSWRKVFQGGVFVEPHMPELREFKNYFLSALQSPDLSLVGLTEEYMAEFTGCVPGSDAEGSRRHILHMPGPGLLFHTKEKGVPCSQISRKEMELRFQQDPKVSFVVKAVSALTAAFRLVQLEACGQDIQTSCLRTVRPGLHQDILENLHKLSFTSMSGLQEVEGTRHHFTKSGRLVANKQILYTIQPEHQSIMPIGWYSEENGLNIKQNVLPSLPPEPLLPEQPRSSQIDFPETGPYSSPLNTYLAGRNVYSRAIQDGLTSSNNVDDGEADQPPRSQVQVAQLPVPSMEQSLGRGWALAVLALSILGIIVSVWMLVYVNIKLCDGTLAGNQSMGLLLLLGNLFIFSSPVSWLLPPSPSVCAIRHFMHPLALCLCFGLLLLKVMQLRSLVSIGLGGKIPQVNQMLSLFFMVMVQVVISTEWFILHMPIPTKISVDYAHCDVSQSTFLLLHLYPTILLVLAFIYSVSVFKIKRNYNEGRWVLVTTILILPIFITAAVLIFFGSVEFQDPSVAVSLLLVGYIILATIFLPKMHTISQQSKVRRLKLHGAGGLDHDTIYTTYNDFGGTSGTPATTAASGLGGGLYYPGYPPPPPQYSAGYGAPYFGGNSGPRISGGAAGKFRHHRHYNPPQPATHHALRFNGLNYLSYPGINHPPTASYQDWSREHSPGHYHFSNLNQYRRLGGTGSSSANTSRLPSAATTRKSSKSPRDSPSAAHRTTTPLLKSVKRCSRTPDSRISKKSGKSGRNSVSRHDNGGLLLSAAGLLPQSGGSNSKPQQPYYDKQNRVYHLTP